MFNILNFIDSQDVREYNKGYHFTPAEQAVLISMSEKTTLDNKINALNELLETYNEDEFKLGSVKYEYIQNNLDINIDTTFRKTVQENIDVWTEALNEYRTDTIYATYAIYNIDDEPQIPYGYFKSLNDAYYDITYRYEINDEAFYVIKCIFANITGVRWNEADYFIYNNKFELIKILPANYRRFDHLNMLNYLDQCYVYIPIPFKKGDSIKTIYLDTSVKYGIVYENYWDINNNAVQYGCNDSSWMTLKVKLKPTNNKCYEDEVSLLRCEYCNI